MSGVKEFGAFVEYLPGKNVRLQLSELAEFPVRRKAVHKELEGLPPLAEEAPIIP